MQLLIPTTFAAPHALRHIPRFYFFTPRSIGIRKSSCEVIVEGGLHRPPKDRQGERNRSNSSSSSSSNLPVVPRFRQNEIPDDAPQTGDAAIFGMQKKHLLILVLFSRENDAFHPCQRPLPPPVHDMLILDDPSHDNLTSLSLGGGGGGGTRER